jgi:hypothetical protein
MVQLLRRENVDFVIVEPSVSSIRRASHGDRTAFENRMRSFGPYVDMHDLQGSDDVEHFRDENHLNQNCVVLFKTALIKKLQAKGRLLHE